MNLGPQLDTMSEQLPWRWKMCWTSRSAVSLAEGSLGRAMKWADLENQSTIVRMEVLFWEGGSPVMKLR